MNGVEEEDDVHCSKIAIDLLISAEIRSSNILSFCLFALCTLTSLATKVETDLVVERRLTSDLLHLLLSFEF